MEKLHSYQGCAGRFHEWRDDLKAKFANWREDHEGESLVDLAKNSARKTATSETGVGEKEDYSHIYRSAMHSSSISLSVDVENRKKKKKIDKIAQHGAKLIEFHFKSKLMSWDREFRFVFYDDAADPIILLYTSSCRRKSRLELIKLSLSVCGIELAYASETGECGDIQ